MKLKYFLFLTLFFFLLSFSFSEATVRYVSKTGTSQPPYTSWQTAADSIQKCINICSFGDTIYVANGVYQEQIIMIPGLSLFGAGMDSCVIDTRTIVTPSFCAITLEDSCIIEAFKIIVSNDQTGGGIQTNKKTGLIKNIKILNVSVAMLLGSSSVIVRDNFIKNAKNGIAILGLGETANPKIINNLIEIKLDEFTSGNAIFFDFTPQTKPEIYNNTIMLDGVWVRGFSGNATDTVRFNNNMIITENNNVISHSMGIGNANIPTENFNNLVIGKNEYGIGAGRQNKIINNISLSGVKGISFSGTNSTLKFNNSWNNTFNYSGFSPDSTNLSVNPMIVNDDTSRGDLDFHLQMFSPLIDAGDPNILDKDGSRSDIGLYGGPHGEKYTYRDLAPKPPSNLTAVMDSGLVKLTWNKNTEADFSVYRVYRDTVPDFMYDTTKIIAVLSDTVFFDDPPQKFISGNYYYKITALDNTDHQSAPSEEAHINITGIPEAPPIVVEHYRLLNNYPNPFNSSTIIPYRLKEGGYVKLYIYDMKGELVRVLVNGYQSAGYYEARFSPTEAERNNPNMDMDWHTGYNDDVASGVYLYQIMVRGEGDIPVFTDMGKMILLK